MNKYVPPSITTTAFNCPYCGALAHQDWFDGHAAPRDEQHKLQRAGQAAAEALKAYAEEGRFYRAPKAPTDIRIDGPRKQPLSGHKDVRNVEFSVCYNCKRAAVWINDNLTFPPERTGPEPNGDLPDDTRADYEEARAILALSPRGAAALLRLAIQKLCKHLGETGESINADIASLVKKGLDQRVQRALDIVRVIGNESVHPGQIDLRDDPDTANELFRLVNLIADAMISQPKHIDAMYERLPADKREAIEKRDAKKD